ncbi:MAG: hypothetical protein ACYS3N_17855, partial [Planctomycetota bacterium]
SWSCIPSTKAFYRVTLTSNLTFLPILTYLRPVSQYYFSSIAADGYDDYKAFLQSVIYEVHSRRANYQKVLGKTLRYIF